jgi:hypothetical protein
MQTAVQTTVHDIHQMNYPLYIPTPSFYGHRNLLGTFFPKEPQHS